MILLDLRLLSQITRLNLASQIAYHTWREKRFLGLLSELLIVLLAPKMIPIVLIMWIFFVHE
jgi:hypothetical protein